MTNCPFCKINKKKTWIIEQSEFSIVIFSSPRIMPGHLLTIPKRHVEKLSELTESELNNLIKLTIKYQEKIIKNIAPGCDIRQHYRPFIKDGKLKVSHLHFHLHPRWPNVKDELYVKCQIHEEKIFKPLTISEINEITRKLAS